jgi:hypothetical protein
MKKINERSAERSNQSKLPHFEAAFSFGTMT